MYQSHLSRSSFSTSAIRLLELMARQIRLQQPNSATFLWAMITSHSYLASFSVVSADSIASCKSFSNSRMLRSKKSFCDWMRCDSTFEQTLWLSTVDLFQVRAWPPTVFLWSDLLRRSVKRWQNYLVNTTFTSEITLKITQHLGFACHWPSKVKTFEHSRKRVSLVTHSTSSLKEIATALSPTRAQPIAVRYRKSNFTRTCM